jgi:hypothetical protein
MGVLMRDYSSIDKLVQDIGDSRVFAGTHFRFSSDQGIKAGYVASILRRSQTMLMCSDSDAVGLLWLNKFLMISTESERRRRIVCR